MSAIGDCHLPCCLPTAAGSKAVAAVSGTDATGIFAEVADAKEHNYICAWCIHGDCETAKADLDASECIVCDAKCSCPCGHA